MESDIKRFESLLRDNGYTVTRSRRSLYENLAGRKRPIGMNTLVTSLSLKSDRSSVYRNVVIFEKLKIIKKVYTGWKYRLELAEQFRPHHHHLTCNICGRIEPLILNEKLENNVVQSGQKQGFRVKTHEIELSGLCPACK